MLLQGLLDWESKSVGFTTNEFKPPRTGDCQSEAKGKKMTEGKRKGRELKGLRRRAHSTSIYNPEHPPRALRAYESYADRRRCVSSFRQHTFLQEKDLMRGARRL
jgi:hypothetical protein